jgi:ABC-type lipoprotein release transport system permease subunit
LSKKSHNAVNVISVISIAGVAVATAAIIVVMSVFNGFADLASQHLSRFDPELMVKPSIGKVIENADSLALSIRKLPGVSYATPTITERGLLVGKQYQMPVIFKGVKEDFSKVAEIDSIMIDGEFTESIYGDIDCTQLSVGVAMQTNCRPNGEDIVKLYVPRRNGRINPANPANAFVSSDLIVSGVFQVNQSEYDADYIMIPLAAARDLLEYDTEASAIEIRLTSPLAEQQVIDEIKALSNKVVVETRLQQQSEAFKMIAIEKWVTFMMLVFILVIASFNILSTLSLLVIEKRDNMTTLRALGASHSIISRIFMLEGILITITGGFFGIILGAILSLAQQYGGFIKLSADPATLTTDVYPVRLDMTDIVIVFAAVAVVAVIASLITRIFTRKIQ